MKINKKVIVRIWLIWGIIGIIVLTIWFSQIIPSPEEAIKRQISAYRNLSYSGLVINKYIDREEHNHKKVVLIEKGQERVTIFDDEIGGVFDFINIGDSIVKSRGKLYVQVIREDLDTIIDIRLYGMNKYDLDSIMHE